MTIQGMPQSHIFEKKLTNKVFAILATDGFEESELLKPKEALEKAGARVDIVSLKRGSIRSWKDKNWGAPVEVRYTVDEVTSADFDGLMLPGGVINSDTLRGNKEAVQFVTDFVLAQKPIAAICHAPWILIETKCVNSRTMTSWPSLKSDLENAGAEWVDEKSVTDDGWVTSRKPEDIPAFNEKMIEAFYEGPHTGEEIPPGVISA